MALLGKDKAFSAPRCVWCGKIEVANPFSQSVVQDDEVALLNRAFFYGKIRHFRLRGAFCAAKLG